MANNWAIILVQWKGDDGAVAERNFKFEYIDNDASVAQLVQWTMGQKWVMVALARGRHQLEEEGMMDDPEYLDPDSNVFVDIDKGAPLVHRGHYRAKLNRGKPQPGQLQGQAKNGADRSRPLPLELSSEIFANLGIGEQRRLIGTLSRCIYDICGKRVKHNWLKWKEQRRRKRFTQEQLNEMESIFERTHYQDPFQRSNLAAIMGLKESQVQNWFSNRRQKYRKQERMLLALRNRGN